LYNKLNAVTNNSQQIHNQSMLYELYNNWKVIQT